MKKRDSGIELLRIIAMMMVILIHAFLYGNYYNEALAVGGITGEISTIIKIAIRPAVNIFILITGFFSVKSTFNLKKALGRAGDTYSRVWFYSVMLAIIFLLLGSEYCIPVMSEKPMPTLQIVLKGIFPVTSQTWYFLTNYLIVCLLAPFINITLQTITKKQYEILLVMLTVLMCICMTLLYIYPFKLWFNDYSYESVFEGKSVFSFIYVYIVGGYFGLHSSKKERPKFVYLFAAAACVLVNYALYTFLDRDLGYRSVSMNYSNPLVILQGVFMLLFFKDLHFYNRFVNILGSTTLGVYAIHEYYFVRSFLWERLFNFKNFDCTNILKNIALVLSISIGIFIAFAIVDIGVQQLFKYKSKMVERIKQKKCRNISS